MADPARTNLQLAIEHELFDYPARFAALEEDDGAFQDFAFRSHPKAYLDAGLRRLPVEDHLRIGLTPDLGDLLSLDGLAQIGVIGPEIVERYGDRFVDSVNEAVWNYYRWVRSR